MNGKSYPGYLDYDRVTSILVEALFFGDARTAKRWGITRQTVINYRNRLEEDSELLRSFTLKKQAFEDNWASEIPAAVKAGIHYLLEAFGKLEYNAENMYAITGAIKILAEMGLTKDIIDARLAGYSRENRTEDRPLDSLPETTD